MKEVLENMNKLISKLDEIVTEYGDKPTTDSQYEKEYLSYPDKARIIDVFTFGRMNLRAGREHLTALPYLFQNNNIFSSSITARAVLETSSLAVWFLTPSIDETERVKRGLIQLCDGKMQAKKVFRDGGQTKEVERIEKFFDDLPNLLTTLGIEFRNKAGNIIEPQQKKPKFFDLIGEIFDDKLQFSYRLLSAIAHGQPNILLVAGYDLEQILTAKGFKQKSQYKPNQLVAMLVLMTAVDSYRLAIESYFHLSNWDFTKIKPSFDKFFISLISTYDSRT